MKRKLANKRRINKLTKMLTLTSLLTLPTLIAGKNNYDYFTVTEQSSSLTTSDTLLTQKANPSKEEMSNRIKALVSIMHSTWALYQKKFNPLLGQEEDFVLAYRIPRETPEQKFNGDKKNYISYNINEEKVAAIYIFDEANKKYASISFFNGEISKTTKIKLLFSNPSDAAFYGGNANTGELIFTILIKNEISEDDIKFMYEDNIELHKAATLANNNEEIKLVVWKLKNKDATANEVKFTIEIKDILFRDYYFKPTLKIENRRDYEYHGFCAKIEIDNNDSAWYINDNAENYMKNGAKISISEKGVYFLKIKDELGNKFTAYLLVGEENWSVLENANIFSEPKLPQVSQLTKTISKTTPKEEIKPKPVKTEIPATKIVEEKTQTPETKATSSKTIPSETINALKAEIDAVNETATTTPKNIAEKTINQSVIPTEKLNERVTVVGVTNSKFSNPEEINSMQITITNFINNIEEVVIQNQATQEQESKWRKNVETFCTYYSNLPPRQILEEILKQFFNKISDYDKAEKYLIAARLNDIYNFWKTTYEQKFSSLALQDLLTSFDNSYKNPKKITSQDNNLFAEVSLKQAIDGQLTTIINRPTTDKDLKMKFDNIVAYIDIAKNGLITGNTSDIIKQIFYDVIDNAMKTANKQRQFYKKDSLFRIKKMFATLEL